MRIGAGPALSARGAAAPLAAPRRARARRSAKEGARSDAAVAMTHARHSDLMHASSGARPPPSISFSSCDTPARRSQAFKLLVKKSSWPGAGCS